MDSFQALLTNPAMKQKNDLAIAVGAAIRSARKQRGMSMKDVATPLKKTAQAVGNWESGANLPSTENLLDVADVLGLDVIALAKGDVRWITDSTLNEAEIVTERSAPRMGPMDVEVLGGAVGGDDGDFSLNGEVAGYVRRPPGLESMMNVFAVHILTDSMVPRYDPGELLYCGGRAPMPGDHVLIEMYPQDGEKNGKAYIKKLKRRTKAEIICEQYNPPGERTFDAYQLKNMWRVIPPRELFGF